MRVAITGVSGFVGQALVERLARCEEVESMVGIDLKPFGSHTKLNHYRMDIRDSALRKVFRRHGVDAVVHLAFILNPPPDPVFQREVNVGGSRNVLLAAKECGARKFVFASSTTVYGAHPDNPEWLTEDDPPRPNIQYAREKAEVEGMCQELAGRMEMTSLRLSTVIGPHIDNPILAYALALKAGLAVRIGEFPTVPLQLVHEGDVVEAFYRAAVEEHPGVYNVGGDGAVDSSYLRSRGMRALRIPVPLAKLALELGRGLGIHFWEPTILDFVRYRWTASNRLIRKEWRFSFKYSSTEALDETIRGGVGMRKVAKCTLPYFYFLGHRLH
jgi:UDP-glucose 4-epimerase